MQFLLSFSVFIVGTGALFYLLSQCYSRCTHQSEMLWYEIGSVWFGFSRDWFYGGSFDVHWVVFWGSWVCGRCFGLLVRSISQPVVASWMSFPIGKYITCYWNLHSSLLSDLLWVWSYKGHSSDIKGHIFHLWLKPCLKTAHLQFGHWKLRLKNKSMIARHKHYLEH